MGIFWGIIAIIGAVFGLAIGAFVFSASGWGLAWWVFGGVLAAFLFVFAYFAAYG